MHTTTKSFTYEIWSDNGVSTYFESTQESFAAVLDEFCADAGYADHADYCHQMDLSESPFNICVKGETPCKI